MALSVEIWSDIACPWCYVGKRRLEAALAQFPDRDQVAITWRAFQLDPRAPRERTQPLAEHLSQKYGMPVAKARTMMAQTAATAAKDGLDLRFDAVRTGRTFDAHRLRALAQRHGQGDRAKERLLRGYFTLGEDLNDRATLVAIGDELGLARAEVEQLIDGDAFAAEVAADLALAQELGIHAVPCFVIERRWGVSGAQPAEVLLGALRQAWAQRAPAAADGPACGPDGAC